MNESLTWLNDHYKRFYVSQHYEDWDPRIFENYSIDRMRAYWELVDPDVVILSSLTHNGKLFCNLEGYGNQHKGLKGVDQLAELSAWARERGKKVVTYLSTIYDKAQYDLHPEWRQVDFNGTPLLEGSFGKVVCPNSPYREYLIGFCQALLRQYPLDGVLLDMVFFEERTCYCDSCRRLYGDLYGGDMPTLEDWSDPRYRELVKFRIESNALFSQELYDAIKEVSPDTAVANQYLLLKDSNRAVGQSLALGAIPDYFYSDVYFGGGFLQMTVCTKALVAVGRNKPEMGIMVRPGNHNDTPHMKSLDHLRGEAFTILANGGVVHMFDIIWPDGAMQEAMLRRIRAVFDEITTIEPWLGGETLKSVAVFYSETSRFWYGRDQRESRYDNHLYGACRALVEEQTLFDIVTHLSANELEEYDVLILPNAVCLDDEEISAVREFVRAGGGLVCTGRTSLWDGEGNARDNLGLAEVMGVTRRGDTSAYSRVYARYDVDHEIARGLPEDGFIACWGTVQKVELTTGKALSRVSYPYTEPSGDRFINIMANPPAVPSQWPASVANQFGAGKVVAFLHHIDRDYLRLSFPELRFLLRNAVATVRSKPSPVEIVDGALCVEINAFDRPEQNQWIVHLVNLQPEIGKNRIGASSASRQQIQQILPIMDLTLRLNAPGARVNSAVLQPAGQELDMETGAGCVLVTLPRLEVHAILEVQFDDQTGVRKKEEA